MIHNEDTRVKIPAIVHLTRLGYEYLSIKQDLTIDPKTNIFENILKQSLKSINSVDEDVRIDDTIRYVKNLLENNDLGQAFYELLIKGHNGIKIIDFDNINNNTFNVVTELTYKNDDEFRPDITILINGLPLSFVEVKKPNNKDGIRSERKRMNYRIENKNFQRFFNLIQLMIFSNNMEYDDTELEPLEGAFYATNSKKQLSLNHFREEDSEIFHCIAPVDEDVEKFILKDSNLQSIKNSIEYQTNNNSTTPTNKILTSLLSKERIIMILKYGIVYLEKTNNEGIKYIEKHIMRYPQLFATLAIENVLNKGTRKGIVWHTQGSGKTALVYFNTKYLKDYYQRRGIIAKFYFIVDRLDLLTQSINEFRQRGLEVEIIESKADFVDHLSKVGASSNTGQDLITVINIQKFVKEPIKIETEYDIRVQRIYFMDEAHRSYNPKGSFLANIMISDKNAIKIALTGTPLIGAIYDDDGKLTSNKYNSKDIFGGYIHRYYYNKSIVDGYTLRLVREGIQTKYRENLASIFNEVTTLSNTLKKDDIYAHPKYVTELVKYIVDDFYQSRLRMNDPTIGAMIVCDSSKQARAIYNEILKTKNTAVLILHDEGSSQELRDKRDDFKKGNVDFVIVYNMLLTGFDSPRLKKLYLGRVIRDHSLLQALTRVNRPYGIHKYGYVVDFADITKEFDKTNQAYFNELQSELGDAFEGYSNLFKSVEEIEQELNHIKDVLWKYDTQNAEVFRQNIEHLDKDALIELRDVLTSYKELYNLAQILNYEDLQKKFDIEKLHALSNEVKHRIDLVNVKDSLSSADNMEAIVHMMLDDVDFKFSKISEEEMKIADQYRDLLISTQTELSKSQDKKDPEYISLLEALRKILQRKNIEELTSEEINEYTMELQKILKRSQQQNDSNQMISRKYNDDNKFMRIHKNVKSLLASISDRELHGMLTILKNELDEIVTNNEDVLGNEAFFQKKMTPIIHEELSKTNNIVTRALLQQISKLISKEYIDEKENA